MNIQTITGMAQPPIFTRKKDKSKQTTASTNPIKNDSFEVTKKDLDIDEMSKMLGQVKDENGKNKFHQGHIATLEFYLKEEPKKWNSVYNLAKNEQMKPDFVYLLASKPLEHLDLLNDIANTKNKQGKLKFSGKEIMNFADKTTFEELQKAKPLTKTTMPVKNMILLAQTPNIPDLEKVADKAIEMEELVGDKLEETQFTRDKYDKNAYVLTAKLVGNEAKSELLDKNLNRLALEDLTRYTTKAGKGYIIKKTADLRNNTVSKVRFREDAVVGRPVFENEIKIIKDKNNKVQMYEYTSPSAINGVFDIRQKTSDGKNKLISSGSIDKKTGIMSVKKDMTSPNGTRTEYLYENDPQGNRIVDYKITNKDGKILMKKSQTFEVINDNKIISSNGNDKYEINIDNNSISVQSFNDKNKKAIFNADKNFIGDKKMLFNTLKQLPGEELIKMRETIDTLKSIDNPLDSYYNGSDKSVHTGGNDFLLLHELGHAVDFKDVDGVSNDGYLKTLYKSITMDKDVNKIFESEKEAFFKKYPEAQREHMDYFMNTLNHYNGETGGLGEAIAESNALLSTAKSYEPLAIRSQYLQQNFPETIAILEQKLNK